MYRSCIGPMLQNVLKQIDTMGGETVQPIATIVISPLLKEWDPSVPFSNPRDWNYSRLLLMIMWKTFRKKSYWWLPGNRLELVAKMLGWEKKYLARSRTGQFFWIIGVWIHLSRIVGSIYRLIAFQSSEIVNQTIQPPLDVLRMHIDTVVASHH